MPEIISRDQAKSSGIKRYFVGSLCLRGHCAERFVINGRCVECAKLSGRESCRKWRIKHHSKSRDYAKRWYNDNKDRVRVHAHKAYLKNKEKHLERSKKYRLEKQIEITWQRRCYYLRNEKQILAKQRADKKNMITLANAIHNILEGPKLPRSREFTSEQKRERSLRSKEWRLRNPDRFKALKDKHLKKRRIYALVAKQLLNLKTTEPHNVEYHI